MVATLFAPAAVAIYAACGGDDGAPTSSSTTPTAEAGAGHRGFESAGQACSSAAQCYVDHDAGDGDAQLAVEGTIHCETKVPNGYCTHECTDDTDCCSVPGECRTSVKQVCSPFTNTENPKYCFLSCEDDDIRKAIAANVDAGGWDGGGVDGGAAYAPDTYCQQYASIYAACRSSGGGKQNRKVCIPKQ
jgi:hypothetical protein